MRGRKPGARALATREQAGAPAAQPRCPAHLSGTARREWRRLAGPLHAMGILTVADRAALAAYCQAYGRWVEAEQTLAQTPLLLKTPSGYVQQSPWLSISNKQLELMGRYMTELGLTPAARSRLAVAPAPSAAETEITTIIEWVGEHGQRLGSDRLSDCMGDSQTKPGKP